MSTANLSIKITEALEGSDFEIVRFSKLIKIKKKILSGTDLDKILKLVKHSRMFKAYHIETDSKGLINLKIHTR